MTYLLHCRKQIFKILFILNIHFIAAQTIPPTNGRTVCSRCSPPGWTILSGTTDVSNRIGWAGGSSPSEQWIGSVINPPNGHVTWVSGFQTERVGSTVSGLTIGESYNFNFYMAEFRSLISGSVTDNFDGVLEITIAGITRRFPFTGGNSNDWSFQTFAFTATSTSELIDIGFETPSTNFWQISFESAAVLATPCSINDPGTIAGTCIGNNNLEFTTSITGISTGGSYSITSGGTTIATGVAYGAATTFTIPGAADGTDKTITIIDDADSRCTRDITIAGATTCLCDSGADGPRFLGLSTSTWIAIGIVSAAGTFGIFLLKRFVF